MGGGCQLFPSAVTHVTDPRYIPCRHRPFPYLATLALGYLLVQAKDPYRLHSEAWVSLGREFWVLHWGEREWSWEGMSLALTLWDLMTLKEARVSFSRMWDPELGLLLLSWVQGLCYPPGSPTPVWADLHSACTPHLRHPLAIVFTVPH